MSKKRLRKTKHKKQYAQRGGDCSSYHAAPPTNVIAAAPPRRRFQVRKITN